MEGPAPFGIASAAWVSSRRTAASVAAVCDYFDHAAAAVDTDTDDGDWMVP